MNLDEELTEAKAAFRQANVEYNSTYTVWKNLPSGTIERAEAEKVKNDAKDAKKDAHTRVTELEAQIKEEKDRLAQGKFIFPFLFAMD
jgi:uncharacterized protein YceH (UPF0502 family)